MSKKPEAEEPAITDAQRRVLQAAVEVFAERGFASASTSEIAKRAGVAEGTIFKQFKTKKELLLGVVAPIFVQLIAPIMIRGVQQILAQKHPDFESFLYALIRDRIALARENRALIRIVLQEVPFQPELRERVKTEVIDRLLPQATPLLNMFVARGDIADDIPHGVVIRTMISLIGGYAVTSFLFAAQMPPFEEEEIAMLVRVIRSAVAPLPGASAAEGTKSKGGKKKN